MEGIKDALLRMIKTALFLKKMAGAYSTIGLDDNPHLQAYGDMCDAIYYLVREHTEEFTESVTYLVLNAPFLSDERRAEMLMSEFKKNRIADIEQPKPNTVSRKEIEKLFKKNGGYMNETPEGDWE